MRILVDAQLPPALVGWLREAGHEAIHVHEIDLGESNDDDLLTYARQNETIIMTKDEDFAVRSQSRGLFGYASETRLIAPCGNGWSRVCQASSYC